MTNRFGYGLIATMATASIVLAGGEGEDKKGEKNKNTRTLERLANSPAPQGATLKAAPGKGFTVDLGDDFSVNIQNRIQVRWTYANMENSGDTNNFAVNRLRTAMGGHVWDKDTTYGVQLEYAMGSLIRDAWLRRNFWTSEDGNMNVALRVGQFRGRHGLEYEGSSFELEHAARSISSRTFSGTRVLGARLEGSALEGGKLNWGIAAVNDDPALASFIAEGGGNVHGAANADNELNFLFDLRFDPMGAMDMSQGDLAHTEELMGTVGASVMVGNHRNGTPVDVESTSININTAWKYQGIYALAEIFMRSDDTQGGTESDHTGWNVHEDARTGPTCLSPTFNRRRFPSSLAAHAG